MQNEFLLVAEITKPSGVEGEVRAKVHMDNPNDILPYKCLYYMANSKEYVPVEVQNIRLYKGFAYFKFKDVFDRDMAEKLRGTLLYISRKDAKPLPDGRFYIVDIIGCTITDDKGEILGTVTDVMQPGANDVFVIKHGKRNILMPVLPHLITKWEVDKGRIVVDGEIFREVSVFED
ncbi:MAG: ribosome maturation factor RimM [Christensenellales bacterium]|jgi:16S rRNA processing protein RimM